MPDLNGKRELPLGHDAPITDEYDRARNTEVLDDYTELFNVLRRMHEEYPHWRFGQLVTNLAGWSGTTQPGNAYDVPDGRLLEIAHRHLADRARRVLKGA